MIKCQCISSEGRRCRNGAEREMQVFQENEHIKIGTGWYWINICEPHFWKSKPLDNKWKWLR